MKPSLLLVILIPTIVLASGCRSNDARIAEMAQRQADREAEHVRQMAHLQGQAAEGSRRLVEADAEARKELTELQRDLRSDQSTVGQQRDALEAERRQIAADRRWDSTVGPAITGAAVLLACLLPLILCVMLLRGLRNPEEAHEALSAILVEELVAERPRLLPRPSQRSALEAPQSHLLEGDDTES